MYACVGIPVYIMYRQRNKSILVNIKEWTYVPKEEGGWYNFIFIDWHCSYVSVVRVKTALLHLKPTEEVGCQGFSEKRRMLKV